MKKAPSFDQFKIDEGGHSISDITDEIYSKVKDSAGWESAARKEIKKWGMPKDVAADVMRALAGEDYFDTGEFDISEGLRGIMEKTDGPTLKPGFYKSTRGSGWMSPGSLLKVDGSMVYYWMKDQGMWAAGSSLEYLNSPNNPYSERDRANLLAAKQVPDAVARTMMGPISKEIITTVRDAMRAMKEAQFEDNARIRINIIT